jgi:hypothetical protein
MRENLRLEFKGREDEILSHVMADPHSVVETSGMFQDEGLYTRGIFRSVKSYFLDNPEDEQEKKKIIRLRSIPR